MLDLIDIFYLGMPFVVGISVLYYAFRRRNIELVTMTLIGIMIFLIMEFAPWIFPELFNFDGIPK